MYDVDPFIIWRIGEDHPYSLTLISTTINSEPYKTPIQLYNSEVQGILFEIDCLLVNLFLDYHFKSDNCNKKLFINNLKVNIVEVKFNIDGYKSNLLSEEVQRAINLWIKKIEDGDLTATNEVANKDTESSKTKKELATIKNNLEKKQIELTNWEKELSAKEEELDSKKIVDIFNKLSKEESIKIIRVLAEKLDIDVLIKLSNDTKSIRRNQTILNQELTAIKAWAYKKSQIVSDVHDLTIGIFYEYLTGYSRNTIGKGMSEKRVDEYIAEDIVNKTANIDKLIAAMEKPINEIKLKKNKIKKDLQKPNNQ